MQAAKVKNYPHKSVLPTGPTLSGKIRATSKLVADTVGVTLGPGGRPVLLEHGEVGRESFATKDGVTVAQHLLGVSTPRNPLCQHEKLLVEMLVGPCRRTAAEAGDGTTTTAILQDGFIGLTMDLCAQEPGLSPQRVVRFMQRLCAAEIQPLLERLALRVDPDTEEGQQFLLGVASTSANSDTELAQAAVDALRITGDEGSVTLHEEVGDPGVRVERQEGYGISVGWEMSTDRYYSKFINEQATQQAVLHGPVFLLYHGRIDRPSQIDRAIEAVLKAREQYDEAVKAGAQVQIPGEWRGSFSVVVVAVDFSEQVLHWLGNIFAEPGTANILPMRLPRDVPIQGWQHQILLDLAAVTGAKVHDPSTINSFDVRDVGPGVERVDMSRWRTSVVGYAKGEVHVARQIRGGSQFVPEMGKNGKPLSYERLRDTRIADVRKFRDNAVSELDRKYHTERLAKLTNGLAKLTVLGNSNAELRERRDRAEDAVCAIRAAIRGGVLPGACWALAQVVKHLALFFKVSEAWEKKVIFQVVVPALRQPLRKLLANAGLSDEEANGVVQAYELTVWCAVPGDTPPESMIYDVAAYPHRWVDAFAGGVLDSLPAVSLAIRNALSASAVVGIAGGSIVFDEDTELQRREALETEAWRRAGNVNEADERG